MTDRLSRFYPSRRLIGVMTAAATLLVGISGWAWWHYVYQDPYNVYWDMLATSLRTTGVTRHLVQQNGGTSLNQSLTTAFSPQLTAQSTTRLQQQSTVLTTETVGNTSVELTRYTQIKTDAKAVNDQPQTFGGILNKWAETNNGTSAAGPNFAVQAIFGLAGGNIVPLVNVSRDNQQRILELLHTSVVFDTSFRDVKKGSQQGRLVYTYKVRVQPVAYAGFQKALARLMGFQLFDSVDPNQYQDQVPTDAAFSVDVRSHRLVGVTYLGQNRTDTYDGYSINRQFALPKASLSTGQLQQSVRGL